MKKLLVLGAGTAGTMVANKLAPPSRRGRVEGHRRRPRRRAPLPAGLPVRAVRRVHAASRRGRGRGTRSSPTASTSSLGEVDRVDPDENVVLLDGRARARPTTTWSSPPARRRGPTRRPACSARSGGAASSTSTPSRAPRRSPRRCSDFDHGRLVVHITEMPIKCPVAPLEFTFLAEAWLRERGLRDRVELVYVTPLDGAFTKPVASAHLGGMLDERKIARRDRLHGRADRRRAEGAGLLRRARGPVRPAGDGPAEHGRRLRRPLRARRRAQLRARRQAHPALDGVRQHLRRSATPATSPPPRPGRSRTSRSRSSSTTSSQHIAGPPDDRLLRRARQLLRRVRRRQGAADRLQLRHRAAARASTRSPSSAR